MDALLISNHFQIHAPRKGYEIKEQNSFGTELYFKNKSIKKVIAIMDR